MAIEEYYEPLEHEGDTDYTLKDSARSAWVTVGSFSVYILRGDDPESVTVSISQVGREASGDIDTCHATKSDLIED